MPQLKPTRGICLNKSHPISRGIVGCWLFNEGSGDKVFDLSGNGKVGIVNNGSWSSLGGIGILCDSNKDCIETSLSMSGGTIVVGLTVNGATPSGGYRYIFMGATTTQLYFIQLGDTQGANEGKWRFNLIDEYVDSALYNLTTGKYYQIAIQWPVRKAWINNDLIIDTTSEDSTITGLNIGGNPDNDLRYANSNIRYSYAFNRALSASEIAQLYREPFCMFDRAWRPGLIGNQIVELAGTSMALSSSSATAKASRKVGGNVVGTSDVAALLNLIRSLLYIESDWKREALFNGMTANAFKLGTTMSLGWFWVRIAGCSVLYRGSSMGEIDFVNILAVAEQDAREISPPSYISHNSGSTYFYVVRRFNNCGYQECTLASSVKVSIESNGELAQPQPNKVFDSGAELVEGNKIQLVWYYCPLEQKSQPMCFNVYYDGRTGQINYENPLAIIGYKGRKFYSYQCGALEAGRYLFAIRTEDASGIENSSLARLRIQFDPTNPDAIDILSAEGV